MRTSSPLRFTCTCGGPRAGSAPRRRSGGSPSRRLVDDRHWRRQACRRLPALSELAEETIDGRLEPWKLRVGGEPIARAVAALAGRSDDENIPTHGQHEPDDGDAARE